MHRCPAEANPLTQYGQRERPAMQEAELDEFTVEGLELDGWLVSEDGIFTISERKLTVDEQAAFAAAKQKELQSFFDDAVWSCTIEVDPPRTMKARFLLKW